MTTKPKSAHQDDLPFDRIAAVLANWSGLPVDDHGGDARNIYFAAMFQLDRPAEARERARRLRSAAVEIETVIANMTWQERVSFHNGYCRSPQNPPRPQAGMFAVKDVRTNPYVRFARALREGAEKAIEDAESSATHAPADSENAGRRARAVAIRVDEIYFRHTGRRVPKAGEVGPFQRLLRQVYDELGMTVIDLRGPLRAVHQFRKNR